ncbi:hypothetical protein [Usitatibacter palustris]|uniref:Ribbon-helix-helix protein, copG family n=1 Tax=Usitatibacter palustris TaxID=2732487 RepID=A0A6M4HAJ2_9PROT|nr:hypothetical protein [Usitatibacter palustris]QJR15868.1 hypothetical protein DSM104440_02694 [Usitatibacter palustris]
MSMKKADLDKAKGKTILGGPGKGIPDRFGKDSGMTMDRREQRERDREAGLIPFAVKLHGDLIKDVRAAAEKKGVGLNEITAELLQKGLKAK